MIQRHPWGWQIDSRNKQRLHRSVHVCSCVCFFQHRRGKSMLQRISHWCFVVVGVGVVLVMWCGVLGRLIVRLLLFYE